MSGDKSEGGELTEFGKELFYFLEAMGLDAKLTASLKKFDFSRTSHLAFVHSMLVYPQIRGRPYGVMQANLSSGGSHLGNALKRTGYCGLGTAVRNLALHTEETLDVDVVVCFFHMLVEVSYRY